MKPILSIDVSKEKSVAGVFLDQNHPVGTPKVFLHTRKELLKLSALLKELEKSYLVKPRVVMEATGNYSKPLTEFFHYEGFEVFVLNPLTTHQLKKKTIRKIKTDPVDVARIAQVFYTSEHVPFQPQTETITSLRELARQYEGLNNTTTEVEMRLISLLDSVFPNYGSLFSSIRNKASLAMLRAWPTPDLLVNASVDEIADVMKPSMRPLIWRRAKAQKALDAARESVGCRSAQTSAAISIRHMVELLVHFQDILTDIRAQMNAIAARSPQYELLRTVPGIGEVTACVILSEVGDINRFATKKQLIAYAGMDPAVFQSGQFTARNNHISKRGSPYLRKALYQAAFVGIAERKGAPVNPVIRRFYDLKKSQGKLGKVALCAAACKLLCMVFGIMKSGKPFEVR